MSKQIIRTHKAPAPIGPYSQAVKTKEFLFVSGQVGINAATNTIIDGGAANETEQIMRNIDAILKEANLTFQHIVKTTIFLSDMNFFDAVNAVYEKYFDDDFPARETVAVKALPKNVNVEISVTAVVEL